jgi:transcriptional regulator with XRE-family HTH domain
MEKHIGDRLAQVMQEQGVSKPELAKRFDVRLQSVYDWVNHGRIAKKHLPLLIEVFNKPLSFWLGTPEVALRHQIAVKTTPDSISIPQYNTGGKMGNGLVLRDQAGIINGWNVNQEWFAKNVPSCTSPKNLAIVTGFGDSMRGIFNSGDPLIVDTGVTSCEYDGIYFFRVGNEGFIKRLQRIPSVGIRVISENKAYESWDIKEGMDFEVFAKILRAWKGENY